MNIGRGQCAHEQFGEIIEQARSACQDARRVVIWGCGNVFPKIHTFLKNTGNIGKLATIVDDNPAKHRLVVDGVAVTRPTAGDLEPADLIIFTFPGYLRCLERIGLSIDGRRILDGSMLDYALSVIDRQLNTICWSITSACNSRCAICPYWRSRVVHLDVGIAAETMNAYPETNHHILGGETFCHPGWRDLLRRVRIKDNILLLTNGLLPERAWEARDEFGITRFSVSLDGGPKSYRKIRGVDGYDKVVRTLRGLSKRSNTSTVAAMVITPFTTLDDFFTVEALCRELGLFFSISVYFEWPGFDDLPKRQEVVNRLSQFVEPVNASELIGETDRRFFNSYMDWHSGKLSLPCTAGLTIDVINERGDVYWCIFKLDPEYRVGNIIETNLSEILTSERFDRVADKLYPCNECWSSTARRFDLACQWRRLQEQGIQL